MNQKQNVSTYRLIFIQGLVSKKDGTLYVAVLLVAWTKMSSDRKLADFKRTYSILPL